MAHPAVGCSPCLSDAEYFGPRWTYAMEKRVMDSARFLMTDWIIGSRRDHPKYPHGTIDYPRELSAKEIADYELVAVGRWVPLPPEPTDTDSMTLTTGDGHSVIVEISRADNDPDIDLYYSAQLSFTDASTDVVHGLFDAASLRQLATLLTSFADRLEATEHP